MSKLATLLTTVTAALAALILAGGASAHPLGNFTVNHHAAIEVAGDTTYVHAVLDLAEIPTVQHGEKVRRPAYAATLAHALQLELDGRPAPLTVVSRRLTEREGAGGLKTLRLDVVYRAAGSGTRLSFRDTSFPDTIGWREITISARDGARISVASVPSTSRSDALRRYPKELLRSPLDVRGAEATVAPGDATGHPPSIDRTAAPAHTGGGFESLVRRGDLSAGVVLLSLLIAAFWGAAHALTPGHGKALVAGYLIGTRGRPRDAVLLGATVTVTHTIGVFALGLVTLALSEFIVPETLYPWLTLVSGLLVVAVGASVLVHRVRSGGWHQHTHDADDGQHHGHHGEHDHADDLHSHGHHSHGHEHHHHGGDRPHGHVHGSDDRLTRRGILGVGVAAGMLPCPSALVVLLGAIALHRVGFGLALIVAFSLGLAATITAIGLVVVLARGQLRRWSFDGPVVRALPALSAVVILGVGVVLTVRAIPNVI